MPIQNYPVEQLNEVYYNLQNERLCYPTLVDGAAVVSANTDWVYGNYAVIVPAGAIAQNFHIVAVSIEACDQNAVFQLELYKAPGDDIVTAVRFAVEGGFFGNQLYAVGSKEVAAGNQIRARLASSNGATAIATIAISIIYYQHP